MKNSGKIILRKFLAISLIIGFTACAGSTESDNNENLPGTVAGLHGQLEVNGTRIIDQNGDPVVLHGMSFFWSQWMANITIKTASNGCGMTGAAMLSGRRWALNPMVILKIPLWKWQKSGPLLTPA